MLVSIWVWVCVGHDRACCRLVDRDFWRLVDLKMRIVLEEDDCLTQRESLTMDGVVSWMGAEHARPTALQAVRKYYVRTVCLGLLYEPTLSM